jgi:hypothetical protein
MGFAASRRRDAGRPCARQAIKVFPPQSVQPALPDFFEARPYQPVAGALDFPAQFRRLRCAVSEEECHCRHVFTKYLGVFFQGD